MTTRNMKTNPNGNIWCGMSARGIIGPHFIQNNSGEGRALTADKYLDLFNSFHFLQ